MAADYYYEDFVQGEQFMTGTHTVDRDKVIAFATEWDPQPFHIDEAAANASIFGGLTACSAHIFAIFCQTSQQWPGGARPQAVASLGFDDTRMLKPVYVGDTLQCRNTVEVTRPSASKPGCGIVGARCELINQHGEVVFSTLSSFLMRCRPE